MLSEELSPWKGNKNRENSLVFAEFAGYKYHKVCFYVYMPSNLTTTPRGLENLTMDRTVVEGSGSGWKEDLARRLDRHRFMLLGNKDLHNEKCLPFGIFELNGKVLLFRGDNVSDIQIQLPAEGGFAGDGVYLTPRLESAIGYADIHSSGGRHGSPTMYVYKMGGLDMLDITTADKAISIVRWLLVNTNMVETIENGLASGGFNDSIQIECAKMLVRGEVPHFVFSTEVGMGKIITELLYGLGYDGAVVGLEGLSRGSSPAAFSEVLIYNPLDLVKVGELNLDALRVFNRVSGKPDVKACLEALRSLLR